LAPTSSTTAALVMGDALAISLLESRGFTREDFARSHPAGQLGRRLLLHIATSCTVAPGPRVRRSLASQAIVDDRSARMNCRVDGQTACWNLHRWRLAPCIG
jgi:arabinose-5-phosphate isomerase